MMHKTFWSLFAVVLACSSATAADIRRVVTGLDANNKAIALFDSRLTLNPGRSGIPAANLWITDSSPPGFSFKDDNAAKPIGLSGQRHGDPRGRISAARSRRGSENGPQFHDEGGRRSRARQGPSRQASADAPHAHRRLRRDLVRRDRHDAR